jgi:hypothetical protein
MVARLAEEWDRCARREVVPGHQLGYLEAPARPFRRRRPALPLLRLVIDPATEVDVKDPATGLVGLDRLPHPERTLTLWADDLLSIRHGRDWMYVVDADRPFPAAWLRLLLTPRDGAGHAYAAVSAGLDGPLPAGWFRVADVAAATYSALIRVEDLRASAWRPGARRPARTPDGELRS